MIFERKRGCYRVLESECRSEFGKLVKKLVRAYDLRFLFPGFETQKKIEVSKPADFLYGSMVS